VIIFIVTFILKNETEILEPLYLNDKALELLYAYTYMIIKLKRFRYPSTINRVCLLLS